MTQGYGEQHLRVPTDGPSRENRRVQVRNITGLMAGGRTTRWPPPDGPPGRTARRPASGLARSSRTSDLELIAMPGLIAPGMTS